MEVLVLRGDGDRVVRDRVERSAGVRAERDALDHRRPIAQRVHLLARQHEAHRALQRARRQHRQHHLKLRAQARAEAAAHEGRHDAHILRLHAEHAAEILLHVLHALGLVVDRELAARLEDHRRGIELHRVVMLDRHVVFGLVAHRGRGQRLVGLAACLRRREHGLHRIRRSPVGTAASRCAMHVRDVRFLLVFHSHQRRRKARDLRRLGDHQRDRLAVEHDLAVVERPVRRAVRRHIVLVGLVVVRHGRTVLVRQHGRARLRRAWPRWCRCA